MKRKIISFILILCLGITSLLCFGCQAFHGDEMLVINASSPINVSVYAKPENGSDNYNDTLYAKRDEYLNGLTFNVYLREDREVTYWDEEQGKLVSNRDETSEICENEITLSYTAAIKSGMSVHGFQYRDKGTYTLKFTIFNISATLSYNVV